MLLSAFGTLLLSSQISTLIGFCITTGGWDGYTHNLFGIPITFKITDVFTFYSILTSILSSIFFVIYIARKRKKYMIQ
jgi:hypothetical protein